MFSDEIQAWSHGPVCVDLYHELKPYGNSPIPLALSDGLDVLEVFTNEEYDSLTDVWGRFGHMSASELRNRTHQEAPWRDAFEKVDKSISIDSVYSFYSNEFGREVDEYEQLIEECQNELEQNVSSGVVMSEPNDRMIEQLRDNHELFRDISIEALRGYLERVK